MPPTGDQVTIRPGNTSTAPPVADALRDAMVANLEAQTTIAKWMRTRASELGTERNPAQRAELTGEMANAGHALSSLASSFRLLAGEHGDGERLLYERPQRPRN